MRPWILACLFLSAASIASAGSQNEKTNVIFVLADDLGYGELGCYGQTRIITPHLDRLAAEGMRFTQFYAGSTVCAPSRSVLMTGQHVGRTTVRGNAGSGNYAAQTLRTEDVTVAEVLRAQGYRTALIGKWGLGEIGSPGEPLNQGFDYHFGFINQTHAHNHFPSYLWRNREKVSLPNDLVQIGTVPGAGYATRRVAYAGDLFAWEAREFIDRNRDQPFFLFLSLVSPHANNERSRERQEGNEVPDQGIYATRPWKDAARNHAAMITRLDRDLGDLLAHLKNRGLDDKTLVIFTSDNGPHAEGGPEYDPSFFAASGPFRGLKRALTDGGIRVPFLVRWPGKIKAGTVSSHVGYFGDILATLAELSGSTPPAELDSLSLMPTLLGRGTQQSHPFLYWEFYEAGVSQAVLLEGRWKGIRLRDPAEPLVLYDLATDPGETTDVAAQHPGVADRIKSLMKAAHVPNAHWSITAKAR